MAIDNSSQPQSGGRKLHGRRKGHKLRPAQQRVLDSLLPRLRVPMPEPDGTLDPLSLFAAGTRAVWLEVGFGAGEHLAWHAENRPDVGLIGADIFQDGIAKLLRRVEDRGLDNVRVHDGDARELIAALPEASLERVFVLFPDPWPKTRHHKRRFVQQTQLDALARVLADGGELRLATDDPSYQRWMMVEMQRHPAFAWTAETAADWRERPADWPPTRYEEKAVEQGRRPIYLRYRRRARGADAG
ncbi:tRNA (guanine-N7-)-methyltransferase [Limimonas halophila]|uniref:tRNA (guanine-N(7)-)-methyltransferase n=1 Tax=Limimonas halophila TaxID=1082479 RepID=A0A1G7SJZ4_9PROT|nr:tRNA (guanosine(46)-N7)-methyltransferase TrmB [Limimonas halophila]SDG23281.1 tRNA (guanine-N7-)-methyltransferase [Limimonas halophila]